jgi:hypothetical protein
VSCEYCAEMRRQVETAQNNNRLRNLELDALHYVWCDGGCRYGVHRFGEHPPLTADIVAAAERSVNRLKSWFINAAGHKLPGTVDARKPGWAAARESIHRAYIAQTEAALESLREERDALRKQVEELKHAL